MTCFETDSRKVETSNAHCKNVIDYCLNVDKFDDLISSFSQSDLKSAVFLLLGCTNFNNCQNLIEKTKEELQNILKDFFRQSNVAVNIFIDLLATMKKFNDLKKLNICKHQLKSFHRLRCISHTWKFLYSLCTEVVDEEVKLINSYYFKNPDETEKLEETICKLLLHNKINGRNPKNLSDAFRFIGRLDLVEEVEKNMSLSQPHNEVCKAAEVKNYFIRQPTATNPCGLAIIINEEKFESSHRSSIDFSVRRGSSRDRDNLQKLWQEFGFHTEVFNNLKSFEVLTLFEEICRNNQDYDIFVACLMSHGQAEIVYGSDGKEVKIADLIDMIANHCQQFYGKPKIFFIQACQEYETAESSLSGVWKTREKNGLPGKRPLADVYEAYSTVPGYSSLRNPFFGSVFISSLVDELSQFGDKEDIDQIMKRVKQQVSHLKQTPITHSTLCRNVLFKRMR